ncbi:hypothetical protein KIPB_011554, partial [Kipferlia bialata]|eukprot:g11554.t1
MWQSRPQTNNTYQVSYRGPTQPGQDINAGGATVTTEGDHTISSTKSLHTGVVSKRVQGNRLTLRAPKGVTT